jgi:hypothetical protein
MWNNAGGWTGDAYAAVSEGAGKDMYGYFFWTLDNFTILGVALMFYFFFRDISEALGIVVASLLLLWGGLEDIFYYFVNGGSVPLDFGWLYANTHLGFTAKLLGLGSLNWLTLMLQLAVSVVIAYFVLKLFWKTNKPLFKGIRL